MINLLIILLAFPLVLAVSIGIVLWMVPITRWYVAAIMAKYDFIFTDVSESYFKEVVRFGGHRKTLLSKSGHKIDEKGNIARLSRGESPETSLPGGLRIVGFPFIDRIYKRPMKFLKSLPNGDIKAYDVENVDKFYAKVDYPYALPFVKCEDKNNLPLLGHATLLAHIVNPEKSLFATANFYDTMVGLVLPSVRECLKGFTFDEIKDKDDLDEIIWAELKNPNPNEPKGVIGRLRDEYGIVIVALRIVNIDPPEEYRDITLTKWKAEREADAAEAVARAEAKKAAGPIGLAMNEWVNGEKGKKESMAQTRARLRKTGEYEKHKKLLADQINRSRGTVQERKIDITSGGEPLTGGSIASIAGSIAAAVIGATAGKSITDKDNPSGGASGGNSGGTAGSSKRGGKKKKDDDEDDFLSE
ncbi:MAG: SPFH domain-containing protein [Candidatus Staskawiczbacteria bacterium]|nr:SPFH domain-containing protein [Candidatus Staskawiczbacteria bacterium]